MANPELVRVLDFILNRCDEAAIDAVAVAVIRRKKDLALFGSANVPDPRSWAKSVAQQAAGGANLASVRETVRSMAETMLRREAPELSDGQIDELLSVWVSGPNEGEAEGAALPIDVARSMVEQFVAYSTGTMRREDEEALRTELGSWPERYWRAFSSVVRAVVTDFLEGRTSRAEFDSQLRSALDLGSPQDTD